MSWASSAVTPIARRMPATMPGACLGLSPPSAADCIVRTVIPRTNSKAKSGATSCRRPVAAARRMSSLSRPRATPAISGIAAATGRLHDVAPDLAFEFVLGITVRTMQSAAEGRLKPKHAPAVVAGILRAIGVTAEEAQEIALRLVTPSRQKP